MVFESLFSSKKEPRIDRRRSLAAIPVLNDGARVTDKEDGTAELSVRIRPKKGLLSRFLPQVDEKRIKLDELGSYVIRQVDGKRSVLQIVERFVEHFGTNRREAELSTAEFFRALVKRRLVSIVIK